ncbi:MAG: NAD(P)/FAD-dependent oxidoreductase [Haloferacaceae archaeon]
MPDTETGEQHATAFDYEVAIVGGGPAGCSAGVFVGRQGLDTVIFDRGRSSIKRCAYLENYLGFPDGIDIETLYGLMHEHAERAGCRFVPDTVASVDRTDDGGFVVEPQDCEPVTARRVVAATRYDGTYMRGLDDEAMFETSGGDGEDRTFDGDYADSDGTTPIEGLYVASPSAEADMQTIVAAGRGARVARRVVADARIDDGWWEDVAVGVDWVRREAELDDEWADRETWVEWFDDYYGEDAPVATGSDRFQRVREAYIDRRESSYVTPGEIEARTGVGHRTLAAHLDVESVVAAVGEGALLDAMDDDAIHEYADPDRRLPEGGD